MTHENWLNLVKGVALVAILLLLRIYLSAWAKHGTLEKAHAAVWKKPRKWQVALLIGLWGLIVAGFLLLLWLDRTS